ncbi:bifunctional diaminohydroxyphosphoribosylaminopyrimidine deaminase/5-amino-6-(5-phosphoribosylamino)uracil reductase RibD [Oceanobacillus damuensis]|uniref:bifunctional diaminohydroxyphosphoribosylaminopyrimidine deaminase/5-amino-6-(5-phosphoribosylamino)uracil reductase RibD n=1 Tax=Oceanobacillus damuensis TaxID=937928 RepID=UPI00082E66F4|nr:bifunctional diaminohydroxyphosphoribosylaminopyrimidine deaminase/5-amino-6-(5-phosphoribosylamino)uracil reductase RibD [Oceanobacillus damuensis]
MFEAILEGRLAQGRTGENPPVGVIIVKDGEIVGRGHTSMQGGSHAEINALRQAGKKAEGATLYSTLEPCAHDGLTPPCCEAVSKAGIKRVVIGIKDPNEKVNGEGINHLIQHEVVVEAGLFENKIQEDLNNYLKRITES